MRRTWIWTLLLAAPLAFGLTGCGGKTEDTAEGDGKENNGKPVIALPTAEKPIDRSYISNDFIGAVVLHPARVLNSKIAKDVIAFAEKKEPGGFDKFKQELRDQLGIEADKVEQVILLVDSQSADAVQASAGFGGTRSDSKPAFIIRNSEDFDEAKLLEAFSTKRKTTFAKVGTEFKRKVTKSTIKTEKKSHAGVDYHTADGGKQAFAVVGGKTLLGGTEDTLKKMLEAKDADSPLAKRLATIGAEHDLIIVGAGKPVEDKVGQFSGMLAALGEDGQAAMPHAQKLKSVAITASATGSPMLSIVFGMEDAESASALAQLLNDKVMTKLKEEYENQKKSIPPDVQPAAEEVMAKLAIGAKGSDLIVSLGRLSQLDDITPILETMAR